jgi:hypothetical protein
MQLRAEGCNQAAQHPTTHISTAHTNTQQHTSARQEPFLLLSGFTVLVFSHIVALHSNQHGSQQTALLAVWHSKHCVVLHTQHTEADRRAGLF